MSTILEAAIGYAKIGLAVFPSNGKKPAISDWPNLASTNEAQIRAWFDIDSDINVSILTGQTVFVVDCDGAEGIEALSALQGQYGLLPKTARSRTGGGGEHWYFRMPPDRLVKNRVKVQGVPIDVRGEKGQVVAPPSIHASGNRYEWIETPFDVGIAEAPGWLLNWIDGLSGSDSVVIVDENPPNVLDNANSFEFTPGAAEGCRHDRALQLVGSHLARGEAVMDVLSKAQAWAKTCHPPMDQEEVLRIVKDIDAKERKKSTTFAEQVVWPTLSEVARYGLAGEFVKRLEPHTEGDLAGLLIQFLIYFGVIIDRSPHFKVESSKHYTNLFAVLVGTTSKGRKGTSENRIRELFLEIDPRFARRIVSGLSSGEGLIWNVRDPSTKKEPVKKDGKVANYQEVIFDHGIEDKRLLVVESEFASVLRQIRREGNTLSPIVRDAWDRGSLQTLTKQSPTRATDAHISIIGHVTKEELSRNISDTENFNGFSNRFLWVCVERSKLLPEGGGEVVLNDLIGQLRAAYEFARTVKKMSRDDESRKLWHEIYRQLAEGPVGLLGAVTSRAEAQVLRLSIIFALLDNSDIVRVEHLEAAAAVWQYAFDSARYVFGASLGDSLADKVLAMIRSNGSLTKRDLHKRLNGHVSANELNRVLEDLVKLKLVVQDRRTTGGRPAEVYSIAAA